MIEDEELVILDDGLVQFELDVVILVFKEQEDEIGVELISNALLHPIKHIDERINTNVFFI